MVFGGYFRRLLPIIKHGNRSRIVASAITKSLFWKDVKILKLKTNMRAKLSKLNQKEIQDFSDYLVRIGEGKEEIIENTECLIKLPDEICLEYDTNKQDIDKLINFVYDDFDQKYKENDYFSNRLIFTTTHNTVNKLNKHIINKIPEIDEKIYYSTDGQADESDSNFFPTEFLNKIEVGGLPPHELIIKKHAIIMLLRNLNTDKGLCNGTRLKVHNFSKNVIDAEITTGKHKGSRVFIPRITLYTDENDDALFFKRRQFPVKLAFAMTINKGQGQTIKKAGLFLDSNLFTHGQLYTALSRVSDFNSIKILTEKRKINDLPGFYVNNNDEFIKKLLLKTFFHFNFVFDESFNLNFKCFFLIILKIK
jgi:ATP-dependent exoDNAse (exonuclease V) alpha subunit